MIEPQRELESLLAAVRSGTWVPTSAEQETANAALRSGSLTAASLRGALGDASGAPLTDALERVATVLDLPPVHEDPATRDALITDARALLEAVAGAHLGA